MATPAARAAVAWQATGSSAFATVSLMMKSNLAGCSIALSPGLARSLPRPAA
jgi:hypothetical protein